MKLIFTVLLYVVCINTFSQTKICFLDSLRICNEEIQKLEDFHNKLINKSPVLRNFTNIRQFHFFVLDNSSKADICLEEYLDYSFFDKLSFLRTNSKLSKRSKKFLISTITFLFSSEGKAIGLIRNGTLCPLEWLEIYNLNELEKIMANNEITFGFCSGTFRLNDSRCGFNGSVREYYCIIEDKIYHMDHFSITKFEDRDNLHLTLFEEYIKNINIGALEENGVRKKREIYLR